MFGMMLIQWIIVVNFIPSRVFWIKFYYPFPYCSKYDKYCSQSLLSIYNCKPVIKDINFSFFKKYNAKAIECDSNESLFSTLSEVLKLGYEVLVQEKIPGNYGVSTLIFFRIVKEIKLLHLPHINIDKNARNMEHANNEK